MQGNRPQRGAGSSAGPQHWHMTSPGPFVQITLEMAPSCLLYLRLGAPRGAALVPAVAFSLTELSDAPHCPRKSCTMSASLVTCFLVAVTLGYLFSFILSYSVTFMAFLVEGM